MTALKRFERLFLLAEKNEKSCAVNLGKARTFSLKQKQKLDQLLDYEIEYRKKISEQASVGISGNSFREFERFLIQLKKVIEQQEQVYSSSLFEVKVKCREWETAYQSRLKMERLVKSCQEKMRLHEEKQVQKVIDELVIHRLSRNNSY